MEIIELETEEQLINMLLSNPNKLYVIDCYAIWCGPCKTLGASLKDYVSKNANKLENVVICKLDIENEDFTEFAKKNNIRSLPTVLFVKGDDVLDSVVGNNFPKIIENIEKLKVIQQDNQN